VAKLTGYLGSSFLRWSRQIVLNNAGSTGVVSTTISADATFDETSAMVSLVNGGASSRNVSALASCEIVGMVKVFKNTGSTNNLVLKDSAASTLATLAPGDWGVIVHNGTAWVAMTSSALASILATASTWTALQTFGAGAALKDSASYLYDDGDATKKAAFQVSGVTTGTTRTLMVPDASGTLALADSAQTFSAAQTFSGGLASTGALTTTDGVSSGPTRKVGGLVNAATAAVTLTNSTTETDLGTYTIPANTLKQGTVLRFRLAAHCTGNAGADTMTFRVKLGGTTLYTTAALAMVNNDVAIFEGELSAYAAPGASAAVAVNLSATSSVSGTFGTKGTALAAANYATNGALILKVTGQWSAASASDVLVADSYTVRIEG
jgi:hypothetical protein